MWHVFSVLYPYSLIHSFIHAFILSLMYAFTHLLAHSCTVLFLLTQSPLHALFYFLSSLSGLLFYPLLTRSFITHWFTHPLTLSPTYFTSLSLHLIHSLTYHSLTHWVTLSHSLTSFHSTSPQSFTHAPTHFDGVVDDDDNDADDDGNLTFALVGDGETG